MNVGSAYVIAMCVNESCLWIAQSSTYEVCEYPQTQPWLGLLPIEQCSMLNVAPIDHSKEKLFLNSNIYFAPDWDSLSAEVIIVHHNFSSMVSISSANLIEFII